MSGVRVLIVSHGHLAQSIGGAEIASYDQYRELRRRPGIESWYLARAPGEQAHHAGTPFALAGDEHEILLYSDMSVADAFRLSQPNKALITDAFPALLRRLRPDVVHFHHYYRLGLELLLAARRSLPQCRIVLTLHEYAAICHHSGLMLRKPTLEPCLDPAPAACARCFPEHGPGDFFMRRQLIQAHFEHVDLFVAPSSFLRQRYVDWGLPAERVCVLENGQPETGSAAATAADAPTQRGRLAFFGQLSPYKGIEVLLDALALVPEAARQQLDLEIHGANLELQEPLFRERLEARLGATRFMGAYARARLGEVLRRCDWVVVPSIWWENSPLVIQEAFAHGRPVICSDIGGMAEKVRDGVDGLHFRAGNAADLARVLERVAGEPGLWRKLHEGVRAPPSITTTVDALLRLYQVPEPLSA